MISDQQFKTNKGSKVIFHKESSYRLTNIQEEYWGFSNLVFFSQLFQSILLQLPWSQAQSQNQKFRSTHVANATINYIWSENEDLPKNIRKNSLLCRFLNAKGGCYD
jgi:hypothetical protein